MFPFPCFWPWIQFRWFFSLLRPVLSSEAQSLRLLGFTLYFQFTVFCFPLICKKCIPWSPSFSFYNGIIHNLLLHVWVVGPVVSKSPSVWRDALVHPTDRGFSRRSDGKQWEPLNKVFRGQRTWNSTSIITTEGRSNEISRLVCNKYFVNRATDRVLFTSHLFLTIIIVIFEQLGVKIKRKYNNK